MANRTLFELLQKESVLSTDIIPIQIDTIDGILNKVTVGQLVDFIHKDNIHILDVTLTDLEQKLKIADIYLDHIADKNFTVYISNNITIDTIISKSYILAELIFSDIDASTYKVYIKYNTIIDDDNTITKKENSITATISKDTGLVNGSIIYATKNYAIYKSTYINTMIENGVNASALATPVTISLTGDATGSVEFDGSTDVNIEVTVAGNTHTHAIADIEGLSTTLEGFMSGSKFTINIGDGVNSSYTITHNLGTEDILVSIIKLATKENTLIAFTIVDINNITIDFGEIIALNTYRVIIL